MKFRATAAYLSIGLATNVAAAQDPAPSAPADKPADAAPPPASPVSEPPGPAQEPPPAQPQSPSSMPPEAIAPPPAPARSEVGPAEPLLPGTPPRRFFLQASLGYTLGGAVKHPELSGTTFKGEMLELAFGTELDPSWQIALAFTSFQTPLERSAAGGNFRATSSSQSSAGLHPLVGCGDCAITGGLGGIVVKTPLHVNTLGPRADFFPYGPTGPYASLTVGFAMMQDLDFRGGLAGAARIGYEWRPFQAMGLSVEAGAHGQVYSDSSAALPYASLQLTLLDPFKPIAAQPPAPPVASAANTSRTH